MHKTRLQISSEGTSRVCGRSLTLASMCFLLLVYTQFVWYMCIPGVEKKYINFTIFIQTYLPLDGRSWNLQFLISLPHKCHIPNLFYIGTAVHEKKIWTDDAWQTPTNSNRSPEWLRHTSRKGSYHVIIKDSFALNGINICSLGLHLVILFHIHVYTYLYLDKISKFVCRIA